tara:strand:+ start:2724 stop:4118 length:1395 start_codon:yes stop_codon:yes gene_type:complete
MKLWGGRFSKATDELVQQFNSSIDIDKRLYKEDIEASLAWANALQTTGILSKNELQSITSGLNQIKTEFVEKKFIFAQKDEDIHTAVERRLTELIGETAGKLHTGRSRNDQVTTDFRIWVLNACSILIKNIIELQKELISNASENLNTPMPGYTHLQLAQPITWGLWILSHFWPLQRDIERLQQTQERTSKIPLGSAALAGTSLNINRQKIAKQLNFNEVSENSLDAVSDRDFAAEFLFCTSLIGIHLSRLSEQLILYSSAEFSFVILDDAYTTGSSLMPQKKNPDTLELTRGKSGRLIGNLTSLLTTLKGLPSAYDKDLQEDKEPVFDSFDTLNITLPVMSGLISSLQINTSKMSANISPSLAATDIADYLVDKNIPFRMAHNLVGKLVSLSEQLQKPLNDLSEIEMQTISKHFNLDIKKLFDVKTQLERRNVTGATSRIALQEQLDKANIIVSQNADHISPE